MPGLDGIEATRQLAGPGVDDPLAIVVITTFDLDDYVHGALKAGARGFLLKDAGPDLLVQAIHAAASGDALIAPKITARLLAAFADTRLGRPPKQPLEPLTRREEDAVVAVARGRTNPEIAAELNISLSTVKTHLASIMAKIGARNRVEIVMWAYETDRISQHALDDELQGFSDRRPQHLARSSWGASRECLRNASATFLEVGPALVVHGDGGSWPQEVAELSGVVAAHRVGEGPGDREPDSSQMEDRGPHRQPVRDAEYAGIEHSVP